MKKLLQNRITILISSAGRRNYLVDWFRDAIRAEGIEGSVIVADNDPHAPACYSADEVVQLPPVARDDYLPSLLEVCTSRRVDLAFSLNDFENSVWAANELTQYSSTTRFLYMTSNIQAALEDKLETFHLLKSVGIEVPPTFSGSELLQTPELLQGLGDEVIIKNRFGSGSYGLTSATSAEAINSLTQALDSVKDRLGARITNRSIAARAIVVQPKISGIEFGLDVINDFGGHFQNCLARRKLGMRDGETSSAISVNPDLFTKLAIAIGTLTRHQGLVDCDVLIDAEGKQWLIDLNPRFGGGYPFSHFAGADVPRQYIRWLMDEESTSGILLESRESITSHKSITMVGEQ